jgi:hypothetical protein
MKSKSGSEGLRNVMDKSHLQHFGLLVTKHELNLLTYAGPFQWTVSQTSLPFNLISIKHYINCHALPYVRCNKMVVL